MQKQENRSERYRTLERVRQATTRDQKFDFNTYRAYVQAKIEPFEFLKIVPAYRMDKITGHLTNELTGQDSDINDYGLIKQPKLSVVHSPWRAASFYANWGVPSRWVQVRLLTSAPPNQTLTHRSMRVGKQASSSLRPAGLTVALPIGGKTLPARSAGV